VYEDNSTKSSLNQVEHTLKDRSDISVSMTGDGKTVSLGQIITIGIATRVDMFVSISLARCRVTN